MEKKQLASFAFSCCFLLMRAQLIAAVLTGEGIALLSIKHGITDAFGRLSNWQQTDESPCNWTGVSCNSSHSVTSLNLSSMNLSGVIYDDIQFLTGLTSLNLSLNDFSGKFPSVISNLIRLESLDISTNQFTGAFPAGFSNLRSLTYLSAHDNNFTGPLPEELSSLVGLKFLDLGGSYFDGSIVEQYSNLTVLETLKLSGNLLTGRIPASLGKLVNLRHLELGYNSYSGGIPREMGELINLEYLDLAEANVSGRIPSELGQLARCSTVFLYRNRLFGELPMELGNMTSLMSLDLSMNKLTGAIPLGFVKLRNLTLLHLMLNSLNGTIPTFIGELPHLQTLSLWSNYFTGVLPLQLGQMRSLSWIDVSSNRLSGAIPSGICDGGSLYKLELFSNNFYGPIPDLTNCKVLYRVRLQDNQLSGAIPSAFGFMPNLTRIEIERNKLNGSIPPAIANAPRLSFLDFSNNLIEGSIPPALWGLPSLQELHVSSNKLSGSITNDVGYARALSVLDLSDNSIGGSIPSNISSCSKLVSLNLRQNKLTGAIPSSLAALPILEVLDLSINNLHGNIPFQFQNLTTLETFNVSYNDLSGQLPSLGLFETAIPSLFTGNAGLCGAPLSPCTANPSDNASLPALAGDRKRRPRLQAWIIVLVVAVAGLLILIVGFKYFYIRHFRHLCKRRLNFDEDWPWKMTAFQRLGFTVDEVLGCLKDSNIIGKGAAGTVYKGEMASGETVAIKRLYKTPRDFENGKDRGFLAEVTVLGSIRHRNIVRLLGYCSNQQTHLLLYEYMPNGSLGELLHASGNGCSVLADWVTRYKIAMGVAQGISYLHHDCYPQIVHRDLKSNNILLDCNMEARVSDFGVAKLIEMSEPMSIVAGSYGYIAPEYAYTMNVDEKSDIYSYGVVLLELLTGKRSVQEPEFEDAVNIVEWVKAKMQRSHSSCKAAEEAARGIDIDIAGAIAAEVLDANLGAASCTLVQEEMLLVLRIALLCVSRAPKDRPPMRDVVTMLSEAKPRRKQIASENHRLISIARR
ncbi:hypothetical protein O6H91_02G091000 [Diphasiastrum complanatum]|uniref:Uncharacterized protein n=1 Tax=Diphasiastrum complanatum TaxID=34168 RepID=A0ACC2EI68_DIPCM|nr:hypothetical protein O6H91_02G091000 [Diphasiastrum complanatum]